MMARKAQPLGPRIATIAGRLLPSSIRGRLLLLLLTLFIPLAVVEIVITYNGYQRRREEEFEANLELARSVAATFETWPCSLL